MRLRDCGDKEMEVSKCDEHLVVTITQEDCRGDVEEVLGMELNEDDAIKLANFILDNFK